MKERYLLDATERNVALALCGCTFAVGTATKRFVRDVAERVRHSDDVALTPRQIAFLHRLSHNYRRQLPAEFRCAWCQKNPDGSCNVPPMEKPI